MGEQCTCPNCGAVYEPSDFGAGAPSDGCWYCGYDFSMFSWGSKWVKLNTIDKKGENMKGQYTNPGCSVVCGLGDIGVGVPSDKQSLRDLELSIWFSMWQKPSSTEKK